MLLLLDNFDSFTYNLSDYLGQLGVHHEVWRNDRPLADIVARDFQAVILSPGPSRPAEAGVMPALIAACHRQVPMLGICLGHQALGEFFGASLVKAQKPMHGKISQITCQNRYFFEGLPTHFEIVRYHSLVLEALPPCLEALAYTNDAEAALMAFKHKELPLAGIQFHPEAWLSQYGLSILKNWLIHENILSFSQNSPLSK